MPFRCLILSADFELKQPSPGDVMLAASEPPRRGKTLGLLANYTADSDFPGFLTSHELAMGFALLGKCIAVHSPPPVL
jgi:hypothetical protein